MYACMYQQHFFYIGPRSICRAMLSSVESFCCFLPSQKGWCVN